MLKLIGDNMSKTKKNNNNEEFVVQDAIDGIAEKTGTILAHYQTVDKRTELGRQIKNLEKSLKKLQESYTADATMRCILHLNESLVDVKASIQTEVDEMEKAIKMNRPTILSKILMNKATKDKALKDNKALKSKKNLLNLVDGIMDDNAKLKTLLDLCGKEAIRNGNKCTNKN